VLFAKVGQKTHFFVVGGARLSKTDPMEKLREELLPVVAVVVQRFAFDLVDLEVKGSKHNLIVRVIADTDGGINIDACATLSRALADELDSKDVLPGKYRLEVSSPGTDRPLRSRRDFQRNLGREANIRWQQAGVATESAGTISAVTDTEVEIISAGESYKIPLADIEVGKIKLKW
jgi:ribosome maturation factor RimP